MAGIAGAAASVGLLGCSPFETALGRRYLDMLLLAKSFCSGAAEAADAADSFAAACLTDLYRVYLGWTTGSASLSWDIVSAGLLAYGLDSCVEGSQYGYGT